MSADLTNWGGGQDRRRGALGGSKSYSKIYCTQNILFSKFPKGILQICFCAFGCQTLGVVKKVLWWGGPCFGHLREDRLRPVMPGEHL